MEEKRYEEQIKARIGMANAASWNIKEMIEEISDFEQKLDTKENFRLLRMKDIEPN